MDQRAAATNPQRKATCAGRKSNALINHAYLNSANLWAADLSGADLTTSEGITNVELERQVASLEGATMLNKQ
jgi:uncharacterized protein YjbI with pentapeptide repeats